MNSEEYVIYKYTCVKTNKSYIGQTKNLQEREKYHQYPSSGCVAFRNAIQKHGWNTFTQEILARHLTLEQANQLEPLFIVKYNTVAPNGYNIRSGGANGELHESTKYKISQALKGRTCSFETIEKRQQKRKGVPKSKEFVAMVSALNTGKKRTEEQRLKMSRAHQGHVVSNETRQKISDANKGKKHPTIICSHCGKIGAGNAMFQWHFDSCKYKQGEL